MAERFLPVLSHFQNANPWSASDGRLRCRILPTVAENEAESTLTVEVWEGPWAYEFSMVEEAKVFPLTEEGLAALPAYLGGWAETVNSRPPRTLEENIRRRTQPT